MPDQPATLEQHGPCAVLTINRPERRNAIDGRTADFLEAAYDEWVSDDSSKVLIVTGAGGQAFCSGADLKDIASLEPRVLSDAGPEGFTRRQSPKPTIAAVEGWCVAGGLELALWCDIRIGGSSSKFGCTERRFGVPLIDGGTQRLPRIVGLGRALELILTGRVIDSTEARSIGLVNEVVADGEALERALEIGRLIAGFPWPTLIADRESTLEAQGLPLVDGLAREADRGAGTVPIGEAGAQRFASGEGRHGASITPAVD